MSQTLARRLAVVGGRIPAPSSFTGLTSPITVAVFGDSRTGNSTFSGNPYRITQQGYLNWACILTRGRLRPLPIGEINFGVAGESSVQISARLSTVLASRAQAVILMGSVNDSSGQASAQTMVALARAIAGAGKLCIAVAEIPRDITGGGWTTARVSQHLAVRQALLDLQGERNILVADPWPAMADPATNGGPKAGMLYDSPAIHQSPTGGYWIGQAIADIVNRTMPEPALLPATNGDAYDATVAPGGCLNANPLMTGTTGTLSGGATGVVPTSWQLVRTGTSLTVVGSKVTVGGKEWLQVAVSGTAADASQSVTIQPATSVHTLVADGETLDTVGEFEMDAGNVGLWGPTLESYPIGTGGLQAQAANWWESGRANGLPLAIAHAGVVRPCLYVKAGTLTSLKPRWIARAESGAAVSATFRVRATAMRKLAF